MRSKLTAIGFALALPAIVAIGAYAGTVITPLLLIGAICTVVILVALGKISGRLLYFYIFGMSLGLIWQTTMMGVDVVGSDVHNEFYYAKLNMLQAWDYTMPNTDNASLVIWLIAPWLSKLLMLDMLWVFKAVLPLFLAFVPVVMFSMVKRQFGETRAFFATVFFMIIPVFSMEIASIAKSMVAEFFFILMVWFMVSDIRWPYKMVGIIGSLAMQAACHYTVGILGICFFLGMFGVRLVTSPLKWGLVTNRKVPLVVIVVCLIAGCGAFWSYHNFTANRAINRSIDEIVFNFVPRPENIIAKIIPDEPTPVEPIEPSPTPSPTEPTPPIVEEPKPPPVVEPKPPSKFTFKYGRATLVETAIGLDFMDVPIGGKLFRIVQFLTQLMIVIGVFRLVFRYKLYKATAEFVGFVVASGMLLAACIFLSGFADTINVTRFYHVSLFFLAPMFVLGCEAIASIGKGR